MSKTLKGPADLGRAAIVAALKRTVKEFKEDNLTAWAAALTYYGVLSLFPAIIVLVAALGLFSDTFTQSMLDNLAPFVPPTVNEILDSAVAGVQADDATPGVAFVVGLLLAFWSASGYVNAFIKASNVIHDVPEQRPFWKLIPVRVGVTGLTGVCAVVSALIIVLSGRLAELAGRALGVGPAAVNTWNVVKWPVLVLLVSVILAVLYYSAPNARLGGLRWVGPGGLLAVLCWMLISVGFALYVANFGSYNQTYGTLAGMIIFLVWLWLSNLAILLGAEVNAELARARAIASGAPADKEPYVELRHSS